MKKSIAIVNMRGMGGYTVLHTIEQLTEKAQDRAFRNWVLKDMWEKHEEGERDTDVAYFDDFYKLSIENDWKYNEKGEKMS